MLLSACDPLPSRPRRVLVAGTSGSGKTTTARRIAELLDIQHTEIDALYHGAGWTKRVSFQAEVEAFSAEPAWVTEWQYDSVRPLLASRADTLVWLHLRRSTVMWRVVARTLRRRLRQEHLWNGNVEPPLRTILTDPDHIVRWAWTTHTRNAESVQALLRQPDLVIVELRNQAQIDAWFAGPLRETAHQDRPS